MEYEGRMLNYISKKENISQRQIAKYMGLSLGQTNFLVHSLVNKGLLKIEKITSRNIKYILTPEGIARNTKRTYKYITNAIKQLLLIEAELISIVEDYSSKGYDLYLDGEKDEIYNLLKQTIKDKKLTQIKLLENTEQLLENCGKALVVLWHNDKVEKYKDLGVECINLLDMIDNL